MVRHTNVQYQYQFCIAKNSWKQMRPEARPYNFYGKNKVDKDHLKKWKDSMYVKVSSWKHECQIFIFNTANPEAQGKSFESEIVYRLFPHRYALVISSHLRLRF